MYSSWIKELIELVDNSNLWNHKWIKAKSMNFELDSLKLWLAQEYFVSCDFVDWFLIASVQTKDQSSKIVLVENIWEELGEGKIKETHVEILKEFLKNLGYPHEDAICKPTTMDYLIKMKEIVSRDFYSALGALGPANEYLLKLEYSKLSKAYSSLRETYLLPEGKFFQVNLNADEGHSHRLFQLIETVASDNEKKHKVEKATLDAIEARIGFYDGLEL